MLEKSFGLFYFLKQPKTTKRPNHYVYLRITVDGVCRDISIKRQWSTSRWDQSTGRATGTKLDAKSINTYIETLSAKVYQAKLSLIENDKIITADSLKNKITGRGDETKMLLQLIVKHNKKMEALIGNGYSLATLKRYQTIHQHTKNFIMWKYGVNDFSINELNYEFGAEYVFWLKAFKNCANNSVIKYVSNLKKIVMECVRKGWLKNDPFIELRFIKDDVIRVALTKDELTTITNKTFITDRLNNVKDIFLFSCYTGLAYVDIFNLRRSQIVRGIDDFLWINIQRQKTGTLSRLPLLPVAFGNWSAYNEDVLGSMFEGLLEKAATESKKGAGQYFTPRPLIDAIVEVMKPDPFESNVFRVSDVACGTAGFLISSYEWWKNNNSSQSLTTKKRNKLFQKTYYGQELVIRPRRMAQMNLYLHGIEPHIILGDTIYEPLSKDRFSCILTNPPFGTKGANQIPDRNDFQIKTSNKQLNFVQHVFSCLIDGGRAAIVLPDNVLFDDKATELWKYLMDHCNLHTILKLPKGTFIPYANVEANVVFLQKGVPTSNVWIYDARSNIKIITKRGRPLTPKYFEDFLKCYGNDPNGQAKREDQGENGRFKKFSLMDIQKRDYKLDVTWLKDNDIDDLSERSVDTSALAQEAISELEIAIEELKEIINLLDQSNEDE